MESKALRSGGPFGIDAVLHEQFKVPAKPAIGIEAATALVRGAVEHGGLPCERLAVSERPVHRGALIDMSGARVSFPPGRRYDHCYVALVDTSAEAQWGHPAHWAFVPADGDGDVVLRPTQFPEHWRGAVRLYGMPPR